MEDTRLVSTKEVRRHATTGDCWLVIEDQVLDVTAFAREHPGGASSELSVPKIDSTLK
jgi:L-lactate dehydrogenase (cytochrome)